MGDASSDTEMGLVQSHTQGSPKHDFPAYVSSDEENQAPSKKFSVKVDVHAEMNDTVADKSDAEMAAASSESSTEEEVAKKRLMATAEQKAMDDEMFSIDYDVPWRTASQNLHRYRVKTGGASSGNKTSGSSTKAAKIPFSRRRIPSLIERPPTLETPKRTRSTRRIIDADQPNADRKSDQTADNHAPSPKGKGRKRKPSTVYRPFVSSDSDSDEDRENTWKRSPPSKEVDSSPTLYFAKKRNALSTMSPQSQAPESGTSLFDAIASGPTYDKGSEIDLSKNPAPIATYGKDHSFKRHNLTSDSDSDDN